MPIETEDHLDPIDQMPLSRGKVTFEFPGASSQYQPPATGRVVSADMLDPLPQQSAFDKLGPGTQYEKAGRNIIGGVTNLLPFGDEIVAGGVTASDKVKSFFGQPYTNASDAYSKNLDEIRRYQEAYNELSPTGGVAENIAGSLVMPGPGWVKGAKGVLKTGAALAGEGALMGGLFGFADGRGTEDRLKRGLVTAGLGAGGSVVLGSAANLGVRVLGNMAAPYVTARRLGVMSPEAGKVRLGGEKNFYTPEEIYLARQLRNTPLEKVARGAQELNTAVAEDVPLFLPEAMQSPKVDRNARFIANYEPSMEFAQTAIGERTKKASERAIKALQQISPEGSSFDGAKKMSEAAQDIISTADKERQALTGKLYEDAYRTRFEVLDPELPKLIDSDSYLQQAIKSVKKSKDFSAMPENSSELLVAARSELGNQIEVAKAAGRPAKARRLTETYNALNDILHSNKELRQADKVYELASRGLEDLNDTFLSNLSKISDDKVKNVSQVFDLPAERIRKLREKFSDAGKLDEWNAGIRAHLQNVVEGSKDGKNFTADIIGDTLQQNKFKAALGDSYEEALKTFQYENRMFEGKNKYHAGSSTAGNLEEVRSFVEGVDTFKRASKGDISVLAEMLMKLKTPDDLAKKMADIYFNPKRGAEVSNKIIPLLEQYGKVSKAATASSEATVRGVAQSGKSSLQDVRARKPPLRKQSGTQRSAPKASPNSKRSGPEKVEVTKPSPNSTKPTEKQQELSSNYRSLAEALAPAVIKVESGGKNDAVSPKGAAGLMQLMPRTAKNLGVSDRFDPEQNVEGGIKLLAEELARFKSVPLALAAYNAGSPMVMKAIEKAGTTDPIQVMKHLPKETQNYLPKVMKALESMA